MSMTLCAETSRMTASFSPTPEDQARADFYALISHLLTAPPSADFLAALANADALSTEQSGSALERAWERLVAAASIMPADAVREEFEELFISTGTPLLNPYASLYLSGFMNEKPLANLRADLQSLGLMRASTSHELEDHLAGLCDAMRVMITGMQGGAPRSLDRQEAFFRTYISPWYARCFSDMRQASRSRFYALVADFSEAFFDIEAQAFEISEAMQTAPAEQ